MVRAGEIGGHLDSVLHDLADYLEASVKLKRKAQAASVYPVFIAGFMTLVIAGLILEFDLYVA